MIVKYVNRFIGKGQDSDAEIRTQSIVLNPDAEIAKLIRLQAQLYNIECGGIQKIY